jgi:hypothetical protein
MINCQTVSVGCCQQEGAQPTPKDDTPDETPARRRLRPRQGLPLARALAALRGCPAQPHALARRRPARPCDGHAPPLRGSETAAIYTPEADHTPEMREALADSDAIVARVLAADALVIGTPIYNFGMPSTLKAFFDHVSATARRSWPTTPACAGCSATRGPPSSSPPAGLTGRGRCSTASTRSPPTPARSGLHGHRRSGLHRRPAHDVRGPRGCSGRDEVGKGRSRRPCSRWADQAGRRRG